MLQDQAYLAGKGRVMDIKPFVASQDLLAQPEALRERVRSDGYLFFQGLLPQEVVSEVYKDILDICREKGWADSQGRVQGPPRLEGHPEFWEVYDAVQRLESFHALAHRPELVGVVEDLVQEEVFVHPRNIARITFPQAEHFTTPPHQDFILIQGTFDTYTAWMPLCACPQVLGGLAALAGSHTRQILPIHKAEGPGGVGIDTEDLGLTWHTADYEPGDVLFLHSLTVHKALPNRTKDQLRISTDFRYQGVSQPVVEDSLDPHYMRLSWDEIYQDWAREDLQYYWRDRPLQVVARDRSYFENL